jgi:hypothetical protein
MTNHIFPTTTMKAQGKKKTGSQQNKYLSWAQRSAHCKIRLCRKRGGRLTAKLDLAMYFFSAKGFIPFSQNFWWKKLYKNSNQNMCFSIEYRRDTCEPPQSYI